MADKFFFLYATTVMFGHVGGHKQTLMFGAHVEVEQAFPLPKVAAEPRFHKRTCLIMSDEKISRKWPDLSSSETRRTPPHVQIA